MKNIYGSITSKGNKVLIGYCSICKRKQFMTVSENTIKAEGLGDFLKNLGEKRLNVSKKMAKNVLSNLGRALELTKKIATAAASRNSKQALSTLPELMTFYNTGKGLYLGLIRLIYVIRMDQKTDKLYQSAPQIKNIDLKERLEKNLNDVNSFNNHINKIKEMITFFKDKNNKSKNKYKKYKTITKILKSFDTFVIIATTSSFITLSLTGIGLIVIPISIASACALSIGNKLTYEIIINKYNK